MNNRPYRPVKIRPVSTGDYTGGMFAFVFLAPFVLFVLFAF